MSAEWENQIRWNFEAKPADGTNSYYIWIINPSPRAHTKIKTNLALEFRPTEDLVVRTGKKDYNDSANHALYTFDSPVAPDDVNWDKVYQGRVIRDTRLTQRQKRGSLEVFVDNQMTKGPPK